MQIFSVFFISGLVALASCQDLIASLDYGTFEGAYSLPYNISYWRKIPFAAPPTGKNRFRAPQPPAAITSGTYDSSQTFDMCPQRTVNGSEDCLYLGLYSRPWTSSQPLRPVVVVFYGGAYIEGGGSFTIPPAGYPVLNVSSTNNFLFVYPNYRVNAFGFLPGSEIHSDPSSDLNPGLLDQQAALKWTNNYIQKFGGDPKNVSIWGQSAGAGSVVAQVIANGGKTTPPLFSKALASSPFWPKTYKYDAPEAQSIYNTLTELTGCVGPDSLKCLKNLDVQTIRDANLVIAASHTYNTSSYTWAPVIDGSYLTQTLSQATIKGEVNIDFGWGMYNTHEGENFIPPGLADANNTGTPAFNSSIASFNTWLRGFLPNFSDRTIQQVESLYPADGSSENIASYNTTYTRAGLIYRDVVLACPSYWMARAAHKTSYVGEYTISPAKHASDTIWWNQVNAIQKTSPEVYEGFTGAFASFFQTGDPNAHKLTDESVPGVPESCKTGEEFVIADGDDSFGNLKVEELNERSYFLHQLYFSSSNPTTKHSTQPPYFKQSFTMAPAATTLASESKHNASVGALGTTVSGKKLKIRSPPKFESLEEERLYRKQHLAAAFRIFADKGFDEGVAGHISVRDPILTDHFWLNPLSQHFSQICVSDLILVNEKGEVVIGDEPINAAAFAIHAEIHKARPDVHAACHAHSVHGKAFSAFGIPLDMITQDSLRFYNSHGVYDSFGGIVLDCEEGIRIGKCLGQGKAVILQNHGILTVGGSVDEAAFWFLSLERTCQAQLLVMAAERGSGVQKRIIGEEEAAFTYKQVGTPEKGWLAFQGYYDEILAKTNGSFLK
ncbi:hypothetical protein G7Y89_g7347 [Cudoniella acicularis]|uniref:Class II aldolase/adducin N-terminal domain-containing protein n=1 Tax=Cudoniella acicularis TaxID=354080 RepID=A0A8H4W265_9HELO|nr:hypothetical protein G7Y89_g7347 [Cudoniella acicularis]